MSTSLESQDTSRSKAATIYEVAEAAGVSIGTVSRVLNGNHKSKWASSAKRAAKIRRVAEEMGYRASWRGRAFASGKTHTIGLINQAHAPLHVGESWHGVFQSLIEQFKAAGYGVQFVPTGEDPDDMRACRQMILERRFDGCVVMKYLTPEIASALEEAGMSAVLVNAEADSSDDAEMRSRWPQVHVDDFGGAVMLTRHLIELGHRRIAFVADDEGSMRHFSLRQRLAGVRQAMRDAGLGEPIDLHQSSLLAAVDQMMAQPSPPTAIVTYHDETAVALLQACWRRGLRVPEQVSVGTFNDSKLTRTSIPPLTTVRLPGPALSRRVAALLLEQITPQHGDEVAERVVLPEELVVRESTAPAFADPPKGARP
jgi:LacI family transcriptional regulator